MTVSAPPTWLSVEPENIPRDLTADASWYAGLVTPRAGRPGKWNKQPGRRRGRRSSPSGRPRRRAARSPTPTWRTNGPGFQVRYGYMTHGSGIIGIDLDDAFAEDGTVKPWAQEIARRLPAPTGSGRRGQGRPRLLSRLAAPRTPQAHVRRLEHRDVRRCPLPDHHGGAPMIGFEGATTPSSPT